jgi:hypothetical protein
MVEGGSLALIKVLPQVLKVAKIDYCTLQKTQGFPT